MPTALRIRIPSSDPPNLAPTAERGRLCLGADGRKPQPPLGRRLWAPLRLAAGSLGALVDFFYIFSWVAVRALACGNRYANVTELVSLPIFIFIILVTIIFWSLPGVARRSALLSSSCSPSCQLRRFKLQALKPEAPSTSSSASFTLTPVAPRQAGQRP